jgi:hypothetical protein
MVSSCSKSEDDVVTKPTNGNTTTPTKPTHKYVRTYTNSFTFDSVKSVRLFKNLADSTQIDSVWKVKTTNDTIFVKPTTTGGVMTVKYSNSSWTFSKITKVVKLDGKYIITGDFKSLLKSGTVGYISLVVSPGANATVETQSTNATGTLNLDYFTVINVGRYVTDSTKYTGSISTTATKDYYNPNTKNFTIKLNTVYSLIGVKTYIPLSGYSIGHFFKNFDGVFCELLAEESNGQKFIQLIQLLDAQNGLVLKTVRKYDVTILKNREYTDGDYIYDRPATKFESVYSSNMTFSNLFYGMSCLNNKSYKQAFTVYNKSGLGMNIDRFFAQSPSINTMYTIFDFSITNYLQSGDYLYFFVTSTRADLATGVYRKKISELFNSDVSLFFNDIYLNSGSDYTKNVEDVLIGTVDEVDKNNDGSVTLKSGNTYVNFDLFNTITTSTAVEYGSNINMF